MMDLYKDYELMHNDLIHTSLTATTTVALQFSQAPPKAWAQLWQAQAPALTLVHGQVLHPSDKS